MVLHETQQAVPVELDQFINSLDAPTRNAARVLLNDLGAGVAGRGLSLNEAIAAGKANLANLAVFGTTLNNRDPDLDRILVGLDGVLGKLTTSDQLTQMSQLITNGQQTLNAIETQQAAFSRQFVDAQTALGELNTAIDSAVPSLRSHPQRRAAAAQRHRPGVATCSPSSGSVANNTRCSARWTAGCCRARPPPVARSRRTNGGNAAADLPHLPGQPQQRGGTLLPGQRLHAPRPGLGPGLATTAGRAT